MAFGWKKKDEGAHGGPSDDAAERDGGEPGDGGSTAPPATGVDPSIPVVDAAAMEALRARAAERDGLHDRVLRLQADLDNFRRREGAERRRAADEEVERILAPVFEHMDTFSRAVEAARGSRDVDALVEGVQLALRELERGLGEQGVRRIEAAGRPLDPTLHRAIQQEPSADVPPMTVLEVFAAGWMRGDRILRPAMVKVSAAPPPSDGGGARTAEE